MADCSCLRSLDFRGDRVGGFDDTVDLVKSFAHEGDDDLLRVFCRFL